jgi:hypothetical protein
LAYVLVVFNNEHADAFSQDGRMAPTSVGCLMRGLGSR